MSGSGSITPSEEEAAELQAAPSPETAERAADDDGEDEKLSQRGKEIISAAVDEGGDDRKDRAAASEKVSSSLGGSPRNWVPEDDDEGFKTPTSPENRIPAVTQCPPAPRRPWTQPMSLKRKGSSPPPPSGARRRLQFGDSSAGEGSDRKDNSVEERGCKRARKEDRQDSD